MRSPDKIPSSAAFDAFAKALETEKDAAIKQGNGIFAFTIKNGATTDSWHLDLKETGKVGKGVAPAGKKATGMPSPVANIQEQQSLTSASKSPSSSTTPTSRSSSTARPTPRTCS